MVCSYIHPFQRFLYSIMLQLELMSLGNFIFCHSSVLLCRYIIRCRIFPTTLMILILVTLQFPFLRSVGPWHFQFLNLLVLSFLLVVVMLLTFLILQLCLTLKLRLSLTPLLFISFVSSALSSLHVLTFLYLCAYIKDFLFSLLVYCHWHLLPL